MDLLIVGVIGLLVGGFHGLGVAIVGYVIFWLVIALLLHLVN